MTVAIILVATAIVVVVGVLIIAYKLVNRLPRDHHGNPGDGGNAC